VIAVRERVLPSAADIHAVAADLTDTGWLTDIPANQPTVLVADRLAAFLQQRDW
jgi:O-methyltransferase involved in polyketide biosynthesis